MWSRFVTLIIQRHVPNNCWIFVFFYLKDKKWILIVVWHYTLVEKRFKLFECSKMLIIVYDDFLENKKKIGI